MQTNQPSVWRHHQWQPRYPWLCETDTKDGKSHQQVGSGVRDCEEESLARPPETEDVLQSWMEMGEWEDQAKDGEWKW